MPFTFPLFDQSRRVSIRDNVDVDTVLDTIDPIEENEKPVIDERIIEDKSKTVEKTVNIESSDHKASSSKDIILDKGYYQGVKEWRCSFSIGSITNATSIRQRFFYTIRLLRHGSLSGCGTIQPRVFYSSGYTLEPRQSIQFPNSMVIWRAQTLLLSHEELDDYKICIDMWQVHPFTFNCIYATYQPTLLELIRGEANARWVLRADGIDVQLLEVQFLLERIFRFSLVFHNWSFVPAAEMPKPLCESAKALRICMRYSNGLSDKFTVAGDGNCWSGPIFFPFAGTFNDLCSSFMELVLLASVKGRWYGSPSQMGKTFISLRSILKHSYLNSSIKKLTYERAKFLQGTISGYLDAMILDQDGLNCLLSGLYNGDPYSNVSHYACTAPLILQLRIIRIEGLSSGDMGEISVRISWDGMLNTTRPTFVSSGIAHYNEEILFPIMLLDQREIKTPPMIRHILPLDLHSRGNILFELNGSDDGFMGDTILLLRKITSNGSSEFVSFKLPIAGANGSPVLVMEARFLPPLPPDFQFIHEPEIEYQPSIFKESEKRWVRYFDKFQNVYKSWFPDAPVQRNFSPLDKESGLPLSTLVTRLRLPAQQFQLLRALHWVSSYPMEKLTTTKSNNIPLTRVSPLSKVLSRKRVTGSRDRALLLAGILLAQRQEVYIAKGTVLEKVSKLQRSTLINYGKLKRVDCYWVITRHGNDICFWDAKLPRNDVDDGRILLKARVSNAWFPSVKTRPDAANVAINVEKKATNEKIANTTNAANVAKETSMPISHKEELQYNAVPLAGVQTSSFDPSDKTFPDVYIPTARPLVSRPNTVRLNTTKPNVTLPQILRENVMNLPFSPNLVFANDPNISRVPYHSIEVVFNANQVWGNLQNHNPSFIFYDFNNTNHWKPFLHSPITPLANELFVGPPYEKSVINRIEEEMHHHIRQLLGGILKRPSNCIQRLQMDRLAELLEDGLINGYLDLSDNNTSTDKNSRDICMDCTSTDCTDDDDDDFDIEEDDGNNNKKDDANNNKAHVGTAGDNDITNKKNNKNSININYPRAITPSLNHWLMRRTEFFQEFSKGASKKPRVALPIHLGQSDLSELSRLFFRDGSIGKLVETLPRGTNFGIAIKAFPLPGSMLSIWVILIITLPLQNT